MLRAIFYARFHAERGPAILHQYPADVFLTDHSQKEQSTAAAATPAAADPLINFQDVSAYIIPAYELCNQALSLVTRGRRVLGWPVSLEDPKYHRNRFTFNVCFVVDESLDGRATTAWQAVVAKAARWFEGIERMEGILASAEAEGGGVIGTGEGKVERKAAAGVGVAEILEQVFEQLNTYGECCARLSDVHVLDLRLQLRPTGEATPPRVNGWDVPLLVVRLPDEKEWTWDLALRQIHPHIDGVNHVRRIAALADVEPKLVRKTVAQLVRHGCATLLDIFHFQAVYAPTEHMAWFARDGDMQAESCRYIVTEAALRECGTGPPSPAAVLELYAMLRPGRSVADFCLAHASALKAIDVRRLVTFGVLKGFLRRMHKYALLLEPASTAAVERPPVRPPMSGSTPDRDAVRSYERAWKSAALSSGWATPPPDLPPSLRRTRVKSEQERRREEAERLRGYLDGKCCLDRVCVEMEMGERRVVERLTSGEFGDVVIFVK